MPDHIPALPLASISYLISQIISSFKPRTNPHYNRYTNITPAAPANTPATPITFFLAPTPVGAAAPSLGIVALEFALTLSLELKLPTLALLELSALALELVTVTIPLPPSPTLLPELSSVGMVVLNSSVMDTAGASPVVVGAAAVVDGVLVPTMLVRPCWALLSSDSVLASTLNGWVWAHVEGEDCALVRPRRLKSAEFLSAVRRILGSLWRESLDVLPVG